MAIENIKLIPTTELTHTKPVRLRIIPDEDGRPDVFLGGSSRTLNREIHSSSPEPIQTRAIKSSQENSPKKITALPKSGIIFGG